MPDIEKEGLSLVRFWSALAIRREIGDRRGEGARLGNLGLAYSELGQPQAAIEYAEPDYIYHALRIPDDPLYASDQWNLSRINAPAAWDLTTGDPQVVVAVLDTGIHAGHAMRGTMTPELQ